jgi:hypothetical protein
LKVLTPLAHIRGSFGCDRITVERAFDVVGGRGVRAIRSRLKRWVAFEVDIEAKAVLLAIASISTALNIVCLVNLVG